MKNGPEIRDPRENGHKSAKFFHAMTTTTGSYQVHTEARGPHWVSWITRPGETKPHRSVLLVAASKEDAELRARQWAEQTER